MAPPPAPQLGGLEPFGYQDTNVQMVYERVEMEVQPILIEGISRPLSRIVVTAYFTMHNPGDEPESMQAVFPLESFSRCIWQNERSNSYATYLIQEETFDVLVDGVDIPIQKIVTDHPYKDLTGVPNGCDDLKMTWAGFDITFPVDEDIVIRVQYVMDAVAGDTVQNIEYILETGAGWAGPIQRGYVIVKFPYMATTENVLPESTPGYQFLYNEVFWSFENLEPTSENNIQVSIVSPDTWQEIQTIRRDLKENPRLPQEWLDLAEIYFNIATWHWDNVRSDQYLEKIAATYEKGIAENPDNAELYARYADFKLYEWSPRLFVPLTEDKALEILYLLNKALALEPTNQTAQITLSNLKSIAPFVTFTLPPSVPPTGTSQFTATPSMTPSATLTPVPSEQNQPIVVTVIHTKLVKVPTPTRKPMSTVTSLQTDFVAQDEKQNELGTVPIVFGALLLFIAGLGVGTFWSKRTVK
jgi:hypothetical protein